MKKEYILRRNYDVVTTIQIVSRTNGKYYAEIVRDIDDLWNENEKNEDYECWIDENGNYMTFGCKEEEHEAICEVFQEYIVANGTKYARKCTCCGKGMNEGYFADYEYFCSDSCLHTEYPPTIWEKIADEDSDSYYWTEWEDEEDFQYVLFNNHLIEF